jgi:hypothetical protein
MLEKNITDDKTDNSHMAGIEERFFIKNAACIAMKRFKTVNWDSVHTLYQYLTNGNNEIIHEDRSIVKHVGHRLDICLTHSNFIGFSYCYDSPAIRV